MNRNRVPRKAWVAIPGGRLPAAVAALLSLLAAPLLAGDVSPTDAFGSAALVAQEPPQEEERAECRCPSLRFFQWAPGDTASRRHFEDLGLHFEEMGRHFEAWQHDFEGRGLEFHTPEIEAWAGELPRFRFEADTTRGGRAMLRAPLVEFFGMAAPGVRYGLRLHDLGPELGRYFGRTGGALVLEVADDAALELRPGDVIVAIDGREVEHADHAVRILRSYEPGETLTLEVWREERSIRIEARAP